MSFSSFFINFVSCFVSFSNSLVVLSVSFFICSDSLPSSFALLFTSSTLSCASSVLISSSFFSDEEVVDGVEDAVLSSFVGFSSETVELLLPIDLLISFADVFAGSFFISSFAFIV